MTNRRDMNKGLRMRTQRNMHRLHWLLLTACIAVVVFVPAAGCSKGAPSGPAKSDVAEKPADAGGEASFAADAATDVYVAARHQVQAAGGDFARHVRECHRGRACGDRPLSPRDQNQ